MGKEAGPSLIWKYVKDENGEKDYRNLCVVSPELLDL